MNKFLFERMKRRRGLLISLAIGCIISIGYIIADVFPYRMYGGTPYNMWIETYSASQFQYIFFLIIPILAALPMSDMYYLDKARGYLNIIASKGYEKKYANSFFLGNLIAGGLSVIMPLLLNLYLCFMLLPNRSPDMVTDVAVNVTMDKPITLFPEMYYNHPLFHIGIYIILGFLVGALYAGIGSIMGMILKNRFFVVLAPFVINYVITMISYQMYDLRAYLPLRFALQTGGESQLGPVLITLVGGFTLITISYYWIHKKKEIL